jgi:ATP/maltotriose-dependent transcriptional regulator MalT
LVWLVAFGRRERLNRIEAAACEVLSEVQTVGGQLTEAVRSLDTSIELFEELGLARQALHARCRRVLLLLESGSETQARLEFEQLWRSPDVDIPRISRLLLQCLGLAFAAGGSAGHFEASFEHTTALVTGIEVPTSEVVRCLRLASRRSREMQIPERSARIEELAATLSARLEDGDAGTRPS